MPSGGLYSILGVSANSTEEEIRRAYKALALRWHPDRHPDNAEDATRRFLEVQEAYRVLVPEEYPTESIVSSPRNQRSGSVSTYNSTYFSVSSSSLGSFIYLPASRTASTSGMSVSTLQSSAPSFKPHLPQQQIGKSNPATVYHPPRYAKDDHSRRTYSSHSGTLGRTHVRHSSENFCQCSASWADYIPPSLPKSNITRPSKGLPVFTIVPPLRKRRTLRDTIPWDDNHIREQSQNWTLRYLGIGPAKEWIFGLALTLEETLNGKHCSFSISGNLVSGKPKNIDLEFDVPPGCREGTKIFCCGVGHEGKDGSRQEVVFIIEELAHDRFSRHGDDLLLNVKIPWDDSLRRQAAVFLVEGLDRRKHSFRIDHPRDRELKGRSVINEAGIPIRSGGKVIGRGKLLIQWEIIPPRSKVLNFMMRFMHFRR